MLISRRYEFFTLLIGLVAAAILLPSSAFAQDPLRLSFVNAAKSGGDSAHETISGFLEASDDISTTPQDEVWDEAAGLDLSQKDFRSSSRREENPREFRQIMRALDIEAIRILDVFSRGRKLQVVVIGPEGVEVADIRKDVRRGRISKTKAKEVLKEAFKALVPSVKAFRDAGSWEAVAEEEPEEEEVEEGEGEGLVDSGELIDGDNDGEVEKKADSGPPPSFGSLDPGYRLSIGALVGRRGLVVEGANEVNIEHESPFIGIGGEVSGIFTKFGPSSALGFSVFGGYAPFTTVFDGQVEIPSQYARLGAQLEYHNMFSEFGVEVFGGAEATSVTLDQNENYTGNRYISGRAGLNGVYIFAPVRFYAGGAVLPVFNTNNSDGAYGEAAFHLSFEFNAGLGFGISDAISATVGYTLQSYGPDYSEPQTRLEGPATSSDVMHTGMIAIGYAL